MWIADHWKDYAVLDCGGGEKIERWGNQILQRPDPQAIWPRDKDCKIWNKPNAIYHRSNAGGGKWEIRKLPEQWAIHYGDLTFQLKPMSFKHTGLFPEQETLAARAHSPNRMTWIVRFIIFFTLGCPEKSLYSLRVSFSTIPSFHALKSPARMCSRAAPTSRR